MFQHSVTLIFCEPTGDWAATARGHLPADALIVQTRNLAELGEQLAEIPAALVAVQWQTERAEVLLRTLAELAAAFPRTTLIVLASRGDAAWEPAAREAGAAHFIVSPRRLSELAQIAAHHHRIELQRPTANDQADLEEQILASLPWGR